MTRLSSKTIIKKPVPTRIGVYGYFDEPEVTGLVNDRGYKCIYEKAYECPCKSKEATHRQNCKNCGGTGWIFVNPKESRMVITSILADGKFSKAQWIDWGMVDSGSAMLSSLNDDKLAFMDRVTIKTATAEHNQILYPSLTDDGVQLFAYTKYDIISIDFIGLFVGIDEPLQKLEPTTDYTFRDNVILLESQYNDLVGPAITIRYIHNPVFHIIDVLRESMTSTKGTMSQGQTQLILPIKALAKRAHLIKDAENYNGNRLLNNSWLPDECQDNEVSTFVRQLQYTSAQIIYDNLSEAQIDALDVLIHESS